MDGVNRFPLGTQDNLMQPEHHRIGVGGFKRVYDQLRPICGFIVNVKAGTLAVWEGEFSKDVSANSHWRFDFTGEPCQVFLPSGRYSFTLAETGGLVPVHFTFTLIGG
jgi:hypothetical protein